VPAVRNPLHARTRTVTLVALIAAVVAAAGSASVGAGGASAGAAPSGAAVARPSIPACALGTSGPDLEGFFAAQLARAERRHGGSAAERRRFSALVAAYVYGLAPVSVRETTQRFPENQLISIAALTNPTVRTVVLPNVDTTYTVGRLQLAAGPMVLDVPDTAGRYYVIQLLDAYSNTFAYVGRRTTGTKPGSYIVVPPGYAGALPAGVTKIQSPTNLVWVLGRTLVRDAADIPAVADLMRGYRFTPLQAWNSGQRQTPLLLPSFPPLAAVVLPEGAAFFDRLNEILRADPPPKRDDCALNAFARGGIGPGSAGAAPEAESAARAARRIVEAAERRANRYGAARNNGWVLPGSYVGAYGRNYLGRAIIATAALGANTRPETIYPLAVDDSKRRPLSGRHRYVVRFPKGQLPPANAFWSLTMYGADRYLVPNPIDRYAVGDRTPGLRRARDGSLTIYVQRDRPKGAKAANWLPAPAGRFRLALRLYEPQRRALRGAWAPPPVRRR
jgi:hypothetical protein